jgi:hypothetical protein
MRGSITYYITAPIRLFGRSRAFRLTLAGILVAGLFFGATLWALDTFLPGAMPAKNRPALTALPPLPPANRQSTIVAPVAVAIPAIRAALDNAAPREFAGKKDNALTQLLGKADMGVEVTRGAMQVTGQADALTITTPLNGAVHLTGQVGTVAGKTVSGLGRTIGSLLGDKVGQTVGDLAGKPFDQKTEFRGNAVVTSRPVLTANWRIEPNLKGQLSFTDSGINIAGVKLNLGNELKGLMDPLVNDQIARLQNRLRSDPIIERTVQREWEKMCRSVALGGGKTGLPALWLEMKPVKAFAAQPKIDNRNVTLTIGVQAETRIGPSQTKPQCPFPTQLDLLPRADQNRLTIGVPIDVPFTEVNKLIDAQLKGRVFGKEAGSAAEVEVRKATVAASGDRLLISLLVKAREKKSWFGFGAEGTVHIWGKPVLDAQKQILRLTDLEVAVESEAAYGLLGAAARAAMPYVQDALAENAVIDLKPFAADARAKIGEALADFRQVTTGVRVDTAVDDLRLVGIAFDSKTLRIITEANGRAAVFVTELPR